MKNRIKELRNKLNLTQQELANIIGVRRETVVFTESGKYNPSLKLAYRIATTLETSIDDVFFFDEDDL